MSYWFQIQTKINCEGFYWTNKEVVQVNDCGANVAAARDIAKDWAREHYPDMQVDAERVYEPFYDHVDVVI